MTRIDFFARWRHYIDHMLPIWFQLGENKGRFFVGKDLFPYLENRGVSPTIWNDKSFGDDPILVAGYSDLQTAHLSNRKRKIIFMEHGVGLVFPGNASYAGNTGYRKKAYLTLAPNKIIYEKTKAAIPEMAQIIIGTPKLDKWAGKFSDQKTIPEIPTVAIAFHWNASGVAPEAGTAFEHYKQYLPLLGQEKSFKVIGHGHPRAENVYRKEFEKAGIEWIEDFDKVMYQADMLVNDCSSIMYEFLVTGKPVVILNSPKFRKNINYGIRFWDYTDIGPHVENGKELITIIQEHLERPYWWKSFREKAVLDLYPYLGESSVRAANAIIQDLGD